MNQAKPIFGNVLKTFAVNEFLISETEYAPYAELPAHSHDSAYCCLVLSGDFLEKRGGKSYLCDRSTAIIHTPHDAHTNSFSRAGGRCLNIQMSVFFLERIGQFAKL